MLDSLQQADTLARRSVIAGRGRRRAPIPARERRGAGEQARRGRVQGRDAATAAAQRDSGSRLWGRGACAASGSNPLATGPCRSCAETSACTCACGRSTRSSRGGCRRRTTRRRAVPTAPRPRPSLSTTHSRSTQRSGATWTGAACAWCRPRRARRRTRSFSMTCSGPMHHSARSDARLLLLPAAVVCVAQGAEPLAASRRFSRTCRSLSRAPLTATTCASFRTVKLAAARPTQCVPTHVRPDMPIAQVSARGHLDARRFRR